MNNTNTQNILFDFNKIMDSNSSGNLREEKKQPKWNILKAMDLFGVPVRFHINSDEEYKSSCGGILTLLTGLFTILSGISLINQLFQHSNAALTTEIQKQFVDDPFDFDQSNFKFAIRIGDAAENTSKDFFSINVSLSNFENGYTASGTENIVSTFSMSKCSNDYFNNTINYKSIESLDSFYCLEGHSFSIFEKISSPEAQRLSIKIQKCKNSTVNGNLCASNDEIGTYFAGDYSQRITIFLLNNYVVPRNPTNYIIQNVEKYEYFISASTGRLENTILANQIKVNSDFNYFYRDYEPRITYSFAKEDNLYFKDTSSNLAVISITKGNDVLSYYRIYTKLIDVISFMGGFGKAIAIIMAAIAIPYNTFLYNVEIANQIYEFDHHTKPKSRKKESRRVSEKMFNNLMSPKFNSERTKNLSRTTSNLCAHMVENEKINMYHPFFKSLIANSMTLKVRFIEFLSNIFCCKRDSLELKLNLFFQANKRIKQDVDIITVLKKLQDVDKLKQLLLNKHQRAIFNYKRPLKIRYQDKLFAFNDLLVQTGVKIRSRSRGNTSTRSRTTLKGNTLILSGTKSIEEEVLRDEREGKFSMFIPDVRYDSVNQFIDLFHSYREIKKNPDGLNKKLVNSLGPKVKTIFEMVDEDMRREINSLITSKSIANLQGKLEQSLDSEESSISSNDGKSESIMEENFHENSEPRDSLNSPKFNYEETNLKYKAIDSPQLNGNYKKSSQTVLDDENKENRAQKTAVALDIIEIQMETIHEEPESPKLKIDDVEGMIATSPKGDMDEDSQQETETKRFEEN